MPSKVTVAWAVPVDAATLGARLEAYAETKAATRTFRLCAKYASDSVIESLPEEIIRKYLLYCLGIGVL